MEISTLKSRLSILSLAHHLGIEVHPRTLKAICPFHPDKTPSLQFSAEKQIATCFSSNCNLGTVDVIGLTERSLNLSKHETLKYLTNLAGESVQTISESPIPTKPGIQADPSSTQDKTYTLDFAAMQTSLTRSKTAQQYAADRHLNTDLLEIGYNPYKNGKFSYLRGCITFPLKNETGNIVSMYGRSIHNNGKAKHYYTKGRMGLYPAYPNPETVTLILTESVIDAATLLSYPKMIRGYEVLALYGTENLLDEHIKAMQHMTGLCEIVLFFDGDEAGRKAVKKHGEKLQRLFPYKQISVVDTPDGEDINSLLSGHDPDVLAELLDTRKAFFVSDEPPVPPKREAMSRESAPPAFSAGEKKKAMAALNTAHPDCITYQTNTLKLTIWGGIEYSNLHRLRLSLFLENQINQNTFRDEVNLYSHRSRKAFLEAASEELELPQSELKTIISDFTGQVETYRLQKRELFKQKDKNPTPTLSESERQLAVKHLKDKQLPKQLKAAMEKIGLVGEAENGLLLFLIFLTRFFENPLHALVHGSSGSGKTNLLKTILKLVPEESKYTTTALSENVLFRPPFKEFWKYKILLLEDLDGSYKALYPLREFMSNQHISKFVSEPDPKTGQFKQRLLEAHGPVVIAGATTKDKVYEDNSNRSFLLHVDESSAQVAKVLSYQNRQAAGLVDKTAIEETCRKVQNIQRVLRPVRVVNPFQPMLELPAYVFKKLRTNTHYITLIKAVTFLNQYQREQKKSPSGIYIETTLEDVELANELSKASLLRKSDELSGQVRDFFERLKKQVQESDNKTFQARAIREQLRIHPMKLNRRLNELRNRGYIKQTGGNRKNGYEYEITIWDDYQVLQKGLEIMDEILDKLYQKYPEGKYNRSVTPV